MFSKRDFAPVRPSVFFLRSVKTSFFLVARQIYHLFQENAPEPLRCLFSWPFFLMKVLSLKGPFTEDGYPCRILMKPFCPPPDLTLLSGNCRSYLQALTDVLFPLNLFVPFLFKFLLCNSILDRTARTHNPFTPPVSPSDWASFLPAIVQILQSFLFF